MIKIMFLCTANSCRSQMAEGLAREIGKGRVAAYSAGLFAAGVHPIAAAVMKEIGIDISGQRSNEIDSELLDQMDFVITLCSHADENCPVLLSGVKKLHWPIEDPVGTIGSEEDIMKEFRRTRDEIKEKILALFTS